MRTYDVMAKLAIDAKPEAERDIRKNLVAGLDQLFPIKGGWRTRPLCEGEKLLREVIAGQQA